MGVAASSSSSLCSKKYEVFLSFRGEDTRRSFTSHLHTALCLKGIETFIDYKLPKGDDISQSLIQAIQDSSLSVIVFSEKYATSKWCLNELIEILHCKEEKGQLVVPIFYQVDPSHVRHQRGAYEEAFAQHLKKNPGKVEEWRKALFKTANLAGWDSYTCRDDAKLIQNIVNDIIKKLNHGSSSALANIVGIDKNCDAIIELLLEEVSTVGIWGMGGIGKTTMAKVVFAKFRSQFDSCCFLENFREESEKHGLKYVRDKLVHELSNDRYLEGFSRRKVLIVLDDVSDTSQLDYLENEAPPFRHGSKVIITSRDRHVLNGRADRIHEATTLGLDSSRELFNLKAFRNDGYKSEYKELVERALAYAQGVPLALTVLGSFLHSRTIKEWESAFNKLERMGHANIQAVLKLSYDGLDDEDKEVFLDIACFLKGLFKGYVMAMLESYGFDVDISLSTLMDKALISIDHGVVRMHDLIQSMAVEIVRQECPTNPERRSRLLKPDEIYDVLKHNRGSDSIRGIKLDLSQIGDLQLSADTFRKMTNLRFLKFYSSFDQRSCTVNLPSGLDSFSKSLSYLQWNNFPLEYLPSSFCAEKLVELRMPNSHIKKLWDGVQNLVNLREINLFGSNYLMELPDISRAQNLNKLSLGLCTSLKSLKAERLPKSIQTIVVFRCDGLKEFSFFSNKMEKLHLLCVCTPNIEVLDFPIGGMEKLKELIIDCSKLKYLPIDAIGFMRSLLDLRLFDYGGIIDKSKLHNLFDSLISLQTIYLIGACKLTELPHNIKHLSRLNHLEVRDCKSLQYLPELPPSIEYLDASNCTSLYSLDLATAPPLRFLLLKDCLKLENHYVESACFPLKRAIYTRKACEICYPGRKVPEWFKSNRGRDASNSISIDLPSSTTDLIGFVLCSVLSHHAHGHHLQCQLYYDGKKHTCSKFKGVVQNFDSQHVFLWCVSDMFINFGKTMVDQNTNYRPNVSFEFSVVTDSDKFVNDVIEVCGVCSIYASEYPKFIKQMELEANLGAQKETCQDADENSFHGILKYANFSLQTGKCGNLEGSNIPEWFTYKSLKIAKSSGLYVRIEVAPDFDKLMGFIFCFVIPNFSSKERDQCYSTFRSELGYEGYYDASFSGPSGWHYSIIKLNSDDVFLWYYPVLSECILKRLKNLRRIKGCDAKLDLIFFFNLGYGLIDDETGETDDEMHETEDEIGETDDETGETEDETGETEDETDETEDETRETGDETGEIDDETGETDDETDETEDEIGETDDETGETDDETGETDDETGETDDETGETKDETGEGEIRIDNCMIKEYGVRPIYVSEYTNFLQQEKLKEVKDSSIDQSILENSESSTSHDLDELLLLLALRNF